MVPGRRLKGEEVKEGAEDSTYGVELWAGQAQKDLSSSWQKCDRSVFDASAVDAIRTTKRREQQQPESAQEVREHAAKPPAAEGAAGSTDLPKDSWQVGFSHTFCTEGPRASKSGKNRIRST